MAHNEQGGPGRHLRGGSRRDARGRPLHWTERETTASRRAQSQFGAKNARQVAAANAYKRNPTEANAIAAAELGLNIPYERLFQDLVIDPRNLALGAATQGIEAQAGRSAAASRARFRQKGKQVGAGAALTEGANLGLEDRIARGLSSAVAGKKKAFADLDASGAFMSPLRNVLGASQGKLDREKRGVDAWTQGATGTGAALSAFPLTAPIGLGLTIGAGVHNLAAAGGYNTETAKLREAYNAANLRRPQLLQPNTAIAGSSVNTQGGSAPRRFRNPFDDEDSNPFGSGSGYRFA